VPKDPDDDNIVTHRDLENLKELIRSEFRTIEVSIDAVKASITIAAHEQQKRDAELNDVRHRFVPREVFEAYQSEQQKKARSVIFGFVVTGLTIVGLLLQVISNRAALGP
jgi:hypothetical protein